MSSNDTKKLLRMLGRTSLLGLEIISLLLLGYFIGNYFTRQTGQWYWAFWGVMIGLLIGVVNVILFIKRYLEETND